MRSVFCHTHLYLPSPQQRAIPLQSSKYKLALVKNPFEDQLSCHCVEDLVSVAGGPTCCDRPWRDFRMSWHMADSTLYLNLMFADDK